MASQGRTIPNMLGQFELSLDLDRICQQGILCSRESKCPLEGDLLVGLEEMPRTSERSPDASCKLVVGVRASKFDALVRCD